jgi:hypothetical protein
MQILLSRSYITLKSSRYLQLECTLVSFPRNYTKPTVICCMECYEIVICQEMSYLNDWEFCWCDIKWKFFKHFDTPEDLSMWRLLQLSLRKYWFIIFQSLCNKSNLDTILELPSSYFADIIGKADRIDKLNSSAKLCDLIQSCNDSCYVSVMCPWGCT